MTLSHVVTVVLQSIKQHRISTFSIIVINIIIIIVSFMQGIYTHIPETDHFPREYTVAAIQASISSSRFGSFVLLR